jgi:hypothetical protein
MKRIGVLTIGQTPRPDLTQGLMEVFGEKFELVEVGALDGKNKICRVCSLTPTTIFL